MEESAGTFHRHSDDDQVRAVHTVFQNVILAIAPLSDEGFRRRTWIAGENPGAYGSSIEEVLAQLDDDIPLVTGELAAYVPLSLDQIYAIKDFGKYFIVIADSPSFVGVDLSEMLADERWPEITRRARTLLELLAAELRTDYEFPPWIHRIAN